LAVLVEMRKQAPDLLRDPHFEVHIDGGCRRGGDIVKALCLGAKGVGVGRPISYALVCYGQKGVAKCLDSQ
jgi:L-lactate dehydrogenase (cytochrome)